MNVRRTWNGYRRYRRINKASRGQELALALIIPAVLFCGSTVRGIYDDGVSAKQRVADQAECRKEIQECQHREIDSLDRRLLHLEPTKP